MGLGAAVQAALDQLPDGAVLADATGRIIAVNHVACRLLETVVEPGDQLADVVRLQDLDGNELVPLRQPVRRVSASHPCSSSRRGRSVSGREVLVTVKLARTCPGGPVTGRGVVPADRRGRGSERIAAARSWSPRWRTSCAHR